MGSNRGGHPTAFPDNCSLNVLNAVKGQARPFTPAFTRGEIWPGARRSEGD
jgi:hypothetical protein